WASRAPPVPGGRAPGERRAALGRRLCLAARRFADVPGARPDDPIERILLDRMAQPADGPADREQREPRRCRQAEHAGDGREGKVYVRRVAGERPAGARVVANEAHLGRSTEMVVEERE